MKDHNGQPDQIDIAVGARIRLRRREIGITQSQLGEAIGVTFQQCQKYERGANRVSASMLVNTARFLKTTVAALVGENGDTTPAKALADLSIDGAPALLRSYAMLGCEQRRALMVIAASLEPPPPAFAAHSSVESACLRTPEGLSLRGTLHYSHHSKRMPSAIIDQRTYYVLRRKDGVLMPSFRGRAGGTYVEPGKSREPPRLFTTTTAAKNALDWWVEGRVQVRMIRDEGSEIVGQTKVEGRCADDWSIVPTVLWGSFPGIVEDSARVETEPSP